MTRPRLLRPIAVEREIDVATASLTEEMLNPDEHTALSERVETLFEEVAVLGQELRELRESAATDERVRQIVKEEVKKYI